MTSYKFPEEPEASDGEGKGLWSGAFPAHGNGGHLMRNWEGFTALTINECCHLYFGMSPLADQSKFWSGAGTLHIVLFNSIHEELTRAVMAGEIRTISLDIPKSKNEITGETSVITKDVLDYFSKYVATETTEQLALISPSINTEKPLSDKERRTYQNIIAALMECIEGKSPTIEKHQSFKNHSELFIHIDEFYKGCYGLSKSNLERKIPEAERDFCKD